MLVDLSVYPFLWMLCYNPFGVLDKMVVIQRSWLRLLGMSEFVMAETRETNCD